MTRETLAQSDLRKARSRLKALETLRVEADHSDVVREAQELVELALKAISGELRTHRELAMDGDVDFIPTERYSAEQAARAYDDAAWVLGLAERVVGRAPAR